MKRIIFSAMVILLALFAACGADISLSLSTVMPGVPVSVEGGNYWSITPAQLASLDTTDLFMVQIDSPLYAEIPGTDYGISADRFSAQLNLLPANKAAKIVVYSSNDNGSRPAVELLVKTGYTQVMELAGGLLAWQQQGYSITYIQQWGSGISLP